MDYKVAPGLYSVGKPDDSAPVSGHTGCEFSGISHEDIKPATRDMVNKCGSKGCC